VGKKKKKKKSLGPDFRSALFVSKSALLLILLNVGVFYGIQKTALTDEVLNYLVLYPGNLLQGKVWTLLTSGFIHHDLTHLLLNMLGIFIFARIVERKFGFGRTLFIYFGALGLSMLFSTVVYMAVFQKSVAIIGASGAVMGLVAAAMLLEPFTITYEMILPLPVMAKGWLFLYADLQGLLGGEADRVSHLSHLFGFLSVAVLVYFLSQEEKKALTTGLVINIISFVGFLYLRNHFWAG